MRGMNADRLARIGSFLQECVVGSGKLPMADILVARDGEPIYRATLGMARADGSPLRNDAIYRIASMTKPITSIVFMQLVEEGKVALDDRVSRIIPEFAGLGVYSGGGGALPFAPVKPCAPMRMVDLMSHMSGLTYGFQNRTSIDAAYRKTLPDGDRRFNGDDYFIAERSKLPLEFVPGTGWIYSVSTDVLGVAISRIEKKPLGEVLRGRVFMPLGMSGAGFYLPEASRNWGGPLCLIRSGQACCLGVAFVALAPAVQAQEIAPAADALAGLPSALAQAVKPPTEVALQGGDCHRIRIGDVMVIELSCISSQHFHPFGVRRKGVNESPSARGRW